MNEGRLHIGPEGRYPSDGLRKVEWTMRSYGVAASSRLWKVVVCRKMEDTELESLLNDVLKQRKNKFKKWH